jgi:hypothetical protein
MPVYYGCPNLAEPVPKESFIGIDIESPTVTEEILRVVQEPVSRLQMEAIGEARRLVLNHYGIIPRLQSILDAMRYSKNV